MTRKPLISVIIPVYNSSKYILRTLDNVRKCLDGEDVEIIVVDDGSVDDTYAKIKKYELENPGVKVFSKKNGGVSSARNLGLDKAVGSYVLFLDADDLLLRNILDASDILRDGKVEILKFDYYSQRRIRFLRKYRRCFPGYSGGAMDMCDVFKKILTTTNLNSACFQLIRRDIIGSLRFNEKYIMAEDLDFNLRLYDKVNKMYYLPKSVAKYVYNKDSATRNADFSKLKKQLLDIIDVYSKLFYFKNKWGVKIEDAEIDKHIREICSYIVYLGSENSGKLAKIYSDKYINKME